MRFKVSIHRTISIGLIAMMLIAALMVLVPSQVSAAGTVHLYADFDEGTWPTTGWTEFESSGTVGLDSAQYHSSPNSLKVSVPSASAYAYPVYTWASALDGYTNISIWFRFTGTVSAIRVFSFADNSGNAIGPWLEIDGTTVRTYNRTTSSYANLWTSVAANAWHHFEANRSGANYWKYRMDGGSWTASYPGRYTYDNVATKLMLGDGSSSVNYGTVWYDDIIVYKGDFPVVLSDAALGSEFASYPVLTAVTGTTYSYTASCPGADTYALASNATWLTINSTTGVLSGTPNASGQFYVNVTASNETASVVQRYTLNVYTPTEITGLKQGSWLTTGGPGRLGQAVYYQGKVFYAFNGYKDGVDLSAYIVTYDMKTRAWSSPVKIGEGSGDGHGAVKIAIDDNGRIHAFFGSHDSNTIYMYSGAGGDISTWTLGPDVDGSIGTTYPMPYWDDVHDVLYLLLRSNHGTAGRNWIMFKSSDRGLTWTSHEFIDMGTDLFYIFSVVPRYTGNNLDFWICGDRRDPTLGYTDYWTIIRYNADGNIYSFGGTNLGTVADATELRTYCIQDIPGTQTKMWNLNLMLDDSGRPHVTVANYTSGNTVWQHIYYSNSSTWMADTICDGSALYNYDSAGYIENYNIHLWLVNGTSAEDPVGRVEQWQWDAVHGWECDGVIMSIEQVAQRSSEGCNGIEMVMHGPNHEVVFGEFDNSDLTNDDLWGYIYCEEYGYRPYYNYTAAPEDPDPPSAPLGLTAIISSHAIVLTWSPPADDGGSPVTGYKVYRSVNGSAYALLATLGAVLTYTDNDSLVAGTNYSYKVSAINQYGEGDASAAVTVLFEDKETMADAFYAWLGPLWGLLMLMVVLSLVARIGRKVG
ncbi:MAG: BNR-4 repeat-containing protein [Methanomassiliicoccales archaeon]|nr:MAG: BNR-4 repeat-containing protein [Methanomassiliicoccales archaeon]